MNNLNRYKQIQKNRIRTTRKIESYIPTPTKGDYTRGFIQRVFIQKVNDKASPIYEISSERSSYYSSNQLYSIIFLKWRISGPNKSYVKNGILHKSVSESNNSSIKLNNDIIPNLKLYLPNLLQFYKS
jgi:hypothetical protein